MDQAVLQPVQVPDTIIINRILGGEKKLFELIIRRYNQRLFRIGMSILNSDAEAEDAMQTAYINAYEHLQNFENRSSFATWLTRIMLNECLAQKKRKQRISFDEATQTQNELCMTTPVQLLLNKELNTVLETAVEKLPEKYRIVFMLREIEDMTVKETAETLDIGEANVKVRLNRAKIMLREKLDGYIKQNVYSFHLTRCDRIVAGVFMHLGL